MEWIATKDKMPDFRQPVWLYPQGIIGSREDGGEEGWLWSNAYGDVWWSEIQEAWRCNSEVDDDYQPTHWMPLPGMTDLDSPSNLQLVNLLKEWVELVERVDSGVYSDMTDKTESAIRGDAEWRND